MSEVVPLLVSSSLSTPFSPISLMYSMISLAGLDAGCKVYSFLAFPFKSFFGAV